MERHLKLLGILHVVNGAVLLLGVFGVLISLLGDAWYSFYPHFPVYYFNMPGIEFLRSLITTWFFGMFVPIVIGLPGIIAGLGLYHLKGWARACVLALGVLNLVNFPLGTLLGIYTIWVLLRPESARLTTS
jgi:hypothetical protein